MSDREIAAQLARDELAAGTIRPDELGTRTELYVGWLEALANPRGRVQGQRFAEAPPVARR